MDFSQHQEFKSPGEHWSHGVTSAAIDSGGASVVLQYAGAVLHSDIEAMVKRAEEWSLEAHDGVVVRKRLLNVLVEALENLRVHAQADLAHTSFAMLTAEDGSYRFLVGNALPSATAELLLHRVEVINAMTEADMKEHFLRLLSSDGRTDRGGAGLGLITIARKGARPLLARTLARDSTTRYFMLEVRVLRD